MPSWGAEFVYEYTRWSEFKNFTATFSPTPIFLPLGAPIPGFQLPEDWKNTSTLRLGSYYALNENWELRGGMAVEQTPIPNKTLNPAIPDADKLTLKRRDRLQMGEIFCRSRVYGGLLQNEKGNKQ